MFGRSWAFGEEFALFIMVIVTFIGISYAVREGRHIRMTAFFDQLSKKKQKYLMLFITFITAAVLFYLSYYSLLFTIRMRSLGRVTPALQIPYYLVVMWAPIGLFTGAIQYVLAFIKNIIEEGPWLSIETETEYLDPEDIKTTGI